MRAIATKQPSNESAQQKKSGDKGRSRHFSPLSTGMPLQRQCACGGGCPRCKEELGIQTKLKIGEPGDKYEQEADHIADEVMRMPEPSVQRQIEPEEEEEEMVQRKAITNRNTSLDQEQKSSKVPPILHEVLNSPGQPLDPATQTFMESRFGHDFSQVRIHTDAKAAESAHTLNATAYTVGGNIVFGKDQYVPKTPEGQRLLAHELTHVLQQKASPSFAAFVQRQSNDMQKVDDMDIEMERKYANSGAPKAQTCGRPSWCPVGFCSPYNSEKLAEYYRSKKVWWLMTGISAVVDSRVVPFWKEYLWGGSDPKNLTADFGKDFTNSPTTKKATSFLTDELKNSLATNPPAVTQFSKRPINIATLIPKAIAALDDPTSSNRMNFSAPRDIPGNLAGDIGKNQTACQAGAKPSPFDDERHASGTVELVRKSGSDITVTPSITYVVKDTIDLCPGDCGSTAEQIATVPLSQFEATGIAGDVPFTVEFPAPALGSFTISAPPAPTPTPNKPSK